MALATPLPEALVFFAAYLVGGIPFGWLFARVFKRVDLRKVGSGSVGATNCSRLWPGPPGIGVFLLIFILDFYKGYCVVLFATDLARVFGHVPFSEDGIFALQAIAGLGGILGHIFTPYLRFRGGKGVATAFGVVTALAPLSSLWGLGAWGMVLGITRYMSLGSLAAMAAITLSYGIDNGPQTFGSRLVVFALFVVMSGFVVWSHRANIARVLQGRERKVGAVDQKL